MQARMKNPAIVVPGAMPAIQALMVAVQKAGTPQEALQVGASAGEPDQWL